MTDIFSQPNVDIDLVDITANASLQSPGLATSKPNAVASRLTNVLSVSYADLEIRDALETLDARGIRNTPDTRRQLRLDVQTEIIDCNGEIVRDFGDVAEKLRRCGEAIDSLNKICRGMRGHIEAANHGTGPLLEEAGSLMSQKTEVQVKELVLEAFTAHYVVSERDLTILTSTAEAVDEEFFQILNRVKELHRDCQALLGTEDQTLGLEILENSSKQLNAAYQKLYRWVQRGFKSLDLENPQISSSIRRSLRVLAERPALFQNCLDFFVEAREQILSDAFYAALTGSDDSDYLAPAKPIDFNAHDPLRYIGDMLAWTHSATVSEREALEILFISEGDEMAKHLQAGIESEPWNKPHGEDGGFDGRRVLNQLVNRNLSGVAGVLRQRMEQVIHSQEDAPLTYKLANLIKFYKSTFSHLLGPDSTFLDVLSSLEESAIRQFRANIKDYVAASQLEATMTPTDLSSPEFFENALEMLRTLIESYDASIANKEYDESGFDDVFREALDPFLNSFKKLADSLRGAAKHIFIVNGLSSVKEALGTYSFTQQRARTIIEELDGHVAKLIEYQHEYLLRASGLGPMVAALAELPDSSEKAKAIFSLETFQPERLTSISQKLDDFLPSALMDAKENLNRLRIKEIAEKITDAAADRFCDDFEYVESRILAADDIRNGDNASIGGDDVTPSLRELFPRTSGEIRVLLS